MILEFPNKENRENKQEVRTEASSGGGSTGFIQVGRLSRPASVNLTPDLFVDETPKKASHAAEPIKDINEIVRVQSYLVSNRRYRDNLLFVLGINVGLRCSDLCGLKVGHLVSDDGRSYRDEATIVEQKTQKTRTIYFNDAVYEAADLYFANCGQISLNDYLIKSEGNRGKNLGQPMNVKTIERLLKEIINDKCGIPVHASTHCLRKTFAYHVIMNAPERSRAIEFLQKIFGHSSQSVTLRYAGITDEEIRDTYKGLNLGSKNPFGWRVREKKIG